MIFLLSLLCNVRHILYELSRLAGSRCPHREVGVTPDLSPLAPGSESGEELYIRVYTLAFLHWPKGRVITRSHTAWLRNYSPGNVVCMSIRPPPHPPIPSLPPPPATAGEFHGFIKGAFEFSRGSAENNHEHGWLIMYGRCGGHSHSCMHLSMCSSLNSSYESAAPASRQTSEESRRGTEQRLTHPWHTASHCMKLPFSLLLLYTLKCVVVGVLASCAAALNIHVFPAFLKFNIKSNFSLLFKKINRNNELVQRSPIMFEFSIFFFWHCKLMLPSSKMTSCRICYVTKQAKGSGQPWPHDCLTCRPQTTT